MDKGLLEQAAAAHTKAIRRAIQLAVSESPRVAVDSLADHIDGIEDEELCQWIAIWRNGGRIELNSDPTVGVNYPCTPDNGSEVQRLRERVLFLNSELVRAKYFAASNVKGDK